MRRKREPRSAAVACLTAARDFLRVDLAMTRFAFRYLPPPSLAILCAPVQSLLAVVEFFLPEHVLQR
jgi:hypothetical protein